MADKTCPRCKETKDATMINFSRDKKSSTGLTAWCRVCINDYYKKRYKPKSKINNVTKVIEFIPEKEIPKVIMPKVNMFKGHSYSIQVPRQGKGTEGRLVRGQVIQETDSFITLQTKNYKEGFSRWELSKYKIMEV